MIFGRWFDNTFSRFNPYSGLVGIAKRMRKPSKGGKFGPTVRIKVPRQGQTHIWAVRNHLQGHGVPTFDHTMDADNFYFRVRKTQEAWAKWLVGKNEIAIKQPKSSWRDRQRSRRLRQRRHRR